MPFQAKEDLILQKLNSLEKDNIVLQNIIKEQQDLIDKLSRMLFGQKRERFESVSPIQLAIEFGGIFSIEELQKLEEVINTKKETLKQQAAIEPKKVHPGRKPLPKHLSIVEVIIKPTEDVSEMVLVGKEESDSLEYEPARFYVQRIIRLKYAPKSREGSFVIAKMPESNFPKCIAGTSLIAQILVDKYVDHLPLYRQLQRFKREEIDINASTIDNWVKLGAGRLELLYQYFSKQIIFKKYLQVDETTLKVLDSDKKGATHLGYFWVYNDPLGDNVLFKYEKGRAGSYPEEVLEDFAGYLQTDGYGGYNALAKREDIIQLACWAHVRRKFEESLSNDKALAETAMMLIQGLYQIEREAREQNLSPQARKELRLEQSLPIYNMIGKWIGQHLGNTLPKSAIGKAMRYAQERWDELGNYMLDGNLEIDNNLVENAIRPVALGRKNYLFAGSHEAAQRSAVIYTFMSQCKKHEINPQKWLQYVFENILDTKPSQYHTLMPQYINKNSIF